MFLATPPCFNTLSFLTMVTTFAPERVIVCLTLRLASVFIFIFFRLRHGAETTVL